MKSHNHYVLALSLAGIPVDTRRSINSPVRHSCWLTSWRWYFPSLRNTGKVSLSRLRLRPQGLSATGHGHPWSNNNTHTLFRYLCYGHLNGAASQRPPPQSWGSQTRAPGSSAVGLIPRVPSDSGKGFHGVAYEGVRETAQQIISNDSLSAKGRRYSWLLSIALH